MNGETDRADKVLVARGFFDSRSAARAAIKAGGVFSDGQLVSKPSQSIAVSGRLSATAAHPYVSRGGLKLSHAMHAFSISPADKICVDLGASTGGFTDVLLKAGASRVSCVDVGRDQLHPRLRADQRTTVYEETDVRNVTSLHVPQDTSLIVADLSFIGLEKALGPALALAPVGTDLVCLFKPQFQVGRSGVGKRGIVRQQDLADAAAEQLTAWMGGAGWSILKWTDSPILGGDGNSERLFHARNTSD
ncbi:MAG: TlyA family RNA methyltransferase [Pseudomonadota bacterium]